MAAESFPLSRCSPEIRDRIWDMAIVEEARSRSVFVHQCRVLPADVVHWQEQYRVRPTCDLVSAIMAVCRESRDRALKIYTLRMELELDHNLGFPTNQWHRPGVSTVTIISCHAPGSGFAVMGNIYLSPDHDLFVMGLAREEHACNLFHYDLMNGSILSRLPHQPGDLHRLDVFRSYISESLSSDDLWSVKRVMQIRHEKCTLGLHWDIRNNHSLICECGFGAPVWAFRNTVDSTPVEVVFPNAASSRSFEFDVTRPRELLRTLSRILYNDFHQH